MNNSKKYSIGKCVYCGASSDLTKDHVPPKALFPKPRPKLITVPCCRDCNSSFQRDDVYFSQMLIRREDLAKNKDIIKLIPNIKKSYLRPEQAAFTQSIQRNAIAVQKVTSSGLYIGTGVAYIVDERRIVNVIERITKGLFYNDKGYHLPFNYTIRCITEDYYSRLKIDEQQEINNKFIIPFTKINPKEIGENIFKYYVYFTEEDNNCSVWLFVFYKTVGFLGLTMPGS